MSLVRGTLGDMIARYAPPPPPTHAHTVHLASQFVYSKLNSAHFCGVVPSLPSSGRVYNELVPVHLHTYAVTYVYSLSVCALTHLRSHTFPNPLLCFPFVLVPAVLPTCGMRNVVCPGNYTAKNVTTICVTCNLTECCDCMSSHTSFAMNP